MNILFIDHDDSFSNNIVSFFRSYKIHVDVVSHSLLAQKELKISQYTMVILSPGPGTPADYPHTITFYHSLPKTMKVLGICLGHQMMLYACGGKIEQTSRTPIHGLQLNVRKNLKSRYLTKIRLFGSLILYNSLGCKTLDPVFKIWDMKMAHHGVCLIAEHTMKPHIGLQFHPESFGSTIGVSLLKQIVRFLDK